MLGKDIAPDGNILVWTTQLVAWLRWYEYVEETLSMYDIKDCPDDIKDDPLMFNDMIENKKKLDKTKNNYGAK